MLVIIIITPEYQGHSAISTCTWHTFLFSVRMLRNRGGRGALGGAGGRGMGRGRGGGQSAAQLLLQKATTQLRGERVPIKPREEDELAVSVCCL